jgi:hypothetical protein
LPFSSAEESAEVAEVMLAERLRQFPAGEYPYLVEVVGRQVGRFPTGSSRSLRG